MPQSKYIINFEYEGFNNEAVVTPFPSERKGEYNFIVEVYTREYIVWKTENGWKDLNGASNDFLMALGNAIDEYHLNFQL